MKRWHEETAITKRNWSLFRKNRIDSNKDWSKEIGVDPSAVDFDLGRFRKKHAFDCGKARCGICHSDKFPKRTLHEQEVMSDLDFKEQIKELYE